MMTFQTIFVLVCALLAVGYLINSARKSLSSTECEGKCGCASADLKKQAKKL